jgi:3',5'-cyclic AMP phosphodiesterase CpdA
MKKHTALFALLFVIAMNTFAQFTFVHISDLHVSGIPLPNSDTNAQYFRCYMNEFATLAPKPAFVLVSGDISYMGNLAPGGMYSTITLYLYPPALTNPGIGAYFIDPDKTIPVYFTPGNHDYWQTVVNQAPVSNDTLIYYTKNVTPDVDYAVTTDIAVIVFLRSGHDAGGNPADIEGSGLSDDQCIWLRNVLSTNSSKRKIITMHHPAVNANGTNSDGTPYTGPISDTADNSLLFNRTTFLNICDSNHVDVVLCGHEHQNVAVDRKGNIINENWSGGTRYIQTAAAFNRSYRVISVDPAFVTVSSPLRSCESFTGINEPDASSGFSFFPNPANDQLIIKYPRKAIIEIVNVSGQVMKTIKYNGTMTNINIGELAKGVYILNVEDENGITSKKLIKQ